MGETTVTYQGSCHCGAVRFCFRSPPITTALQCNCSICIRKNAVMSTVYFDPGDFDLLSGREALAVYRWNDRDVNHYFCRHCGIYPFHDSIHSPGQYRVNLGCVHDLDVRALDTQWFDGRHRL